MLLFRLCIKCLFALAIISIILSIALLVTSVNKSNHTVQVVTVRDFLLHTKENVYANNDYYLNSSNSTDYHLDPHADDIITRGKWQQTIISKYCSNINKTRTTKEKAQDHLRHLIYDDNYGIIYCVVPKTGCTKMKLLFLLLQGIYNVDELLTQEKITHKAHLHKVKSLLDLSEAEREIRLEQYYKFMVVRDPLERLISAYRNKISRKNMQEESFLHLRHDIINKFHNRSTNDSKLQEKGAEEEIIPTFPEFIKYFIAHKDLLDDHFQSAFDLCQPCRINYDFYAHFSTLNADMRSLLSTFKIPKYYYFNDIKIGPSVMPKNNSRKDISKSYYSQLGDKLKEKLMNKLAIDNDMYHQLFSHNIN